MRDNKIIKLKSNVMKSIQSKITKRNKTEGYRLIKKMEKRLDWYFADLGISDTLKSA